MIIVVQIPLFDPRGEIFPGREDKLTKPVWPAPTDTCSFIRSSGAVFERRAKGLHGFFAEDWLCNARRFVRFPEIPPLRTIEIDEDAFVSQATPRVAFRHLFMDGRHTAKLEIGFYLQPGEALDAIVGSNFQDLVEHILGLTVEAGSDQEARALISLGPQAAHALERATGRHAWLCTRLWRHLTRRNPAEIQAGPPFVIGIVKSTQFVGGLPPSPSLAKVGACTVSAWRRHLHSKRYDLVVISEPPRSADLVRNLRLFLNRCHAELVATEFALGRIAGLAAARIGQRKVEILKAELASLHSARLSHIASLTRRIGTSARALRGGKDTDPVEIGGAVLASIWGGRVDGILERADILSEKLDRRFKSQTGSLVRSSLKRTVFISYRRRDTGALARKLVDRLTAVFPQSDFFLDLVSLTPGGAWQKELETAIAKCSHVLALIGPDWVGLNPLGERRIDSPIDPVRLEIETALEFEKRFLPVFANSGDAPFQLDDLPASLRPIGSFHGRSISNDLTAQDLKFIEQFLKVY